MAEVLYRKYRSRTFAEVQGQEAIISVLTHSLRSGKFAHAYLFAGPRGTGKTTIARLVSKAVNCEKFGETGDVCNVCESCLAVESGNHIDILEIDAASNRGIEEIRQIRDTINFLPNSGKFKVYIIDEAHMLTREAFNALLKTLEEPPAHVVFIMATTEAHKVPVTILSRVQRYDFKLATPEQLTAKLAKILEAEDAKAEAGVLDMIYRYSEGSYRDAESILGKLLSSHQTDKEITITQASSLLGIPSIILVNELSGLLIAGDTFAAMEKIAESVTAGNDIAHLVKSIVGYLRGRITELVKNNQSYERELQVLHVLMALQSEMRMVDDMRLLLEVAVLKLGKANAVESKPQKTESSTAAVAEPPRAAVKPPTIPEVKAKPASKPVAREAAPVANAGAATDGQWERLLTEMRKKDFRLWTVLKTCRPQLKDQLLILETNYHSNVAILQNVDAVSKIRPLLDTVYSAEIQFEVISNAAPSRINAENALQGDFMPDSNASLVEEIF